MLTAAALVPVPPLLVPEVAGGSAARDDDLREACRAAVSTLLASRPDRVVVIGLAPRTEVYPGSWDFRPWGVAHPAVPPADRLPLALAIGAWLLDTTPGGVAVDRVLQGVTSIPRARAADLGAALVADGRIGLLICGDGSARRDEKAPGHFDPRAGGFDDAVVAAVSGAEPRALLDLDPLLAEALLVSGLPGWQVLAGAAAGGAWTAQVGYAGAP
ncbi:MAG: hypothetical protein JWL64_223, partial [Frankiales bacterium]|nr:hypothetical protein [Frankiales bacterium]